jgi:hypothetical protein
MLPKLPNVPVAYRYFESEAMLDFSVGFVDSNWLR